MILASNSPRRKELLAQAGFSFRVYTEHVDESYPADLPRAQVATYLAEKKAGHYLKDVKGEIILTADTTVVLDGQLLEKPAGDSEAMEMLGRLSGKAHEVITGVCIAFGNKCEVFSVTTKVFFKQLEKEEISHYVERYRPLDKAGAYGIQEWIGMIGIRRIEGSYFNVVGLPVHEVYEALSRFRR